MKRILSVLLLLVLLGTGCTHSKTLPNQGEQEELVTIAYPTAGEGNLADIANFFAQQAYDMSGGKVRVVMMQTDNILADMENHVADYYLVDNTALSQKGSFLSMLDSPFFLTDLKTTTDKMNGEKTLKLINELLDDEKHFRVMGAMACGYWYLLTQWDEAADPSETKVNTVYYQGAMLPTLVQDKVKVKQLPLSRESLLHDSKIGSYWETTLPFVLEQKLCNEDTYVYDTRHRTILYWILQDTRGAENHTNKTTAMVKEAWIRTIGYSYTEGEKQNTAFIERMTKEGNTPITAQLWNYKQTLSAAIAENIKQIPQWDVQFYKQLGSA